MPINELCYHCRQYPAPNPGEAFCLVCQEWLKEKKAWKERVFKRDEIIKELEKQPANNPNPQPYLLNLLTKHKQFAHTQRLYTPQETQEREFLDKVAKELISGLLGETKYSQLSK